MFNIALQCIVITYWDQGQAYLRSLGRSQPGLLLGRRSAPVDHIFEIRIKYSNKPAATVPLFKIDQILGIQIRYSNRTGHTVSWKHDLHDPLPPFRSNNQTMKQDGMWFCFWIFNLTVKFENNSNEQWSFRLRQSLLEGGDKVSTSKSWLVKGAVVFIGPIKTYLVF